MSRFTGKYDLYDEIKLLGNGDIQQGFNVFKGTKLYVQTEGKFNDTRLTWKQALQRSRKLVKYEQLLDIAPYFTYVVQVQYNSNNQDKQKDLIVLTKKPWYDIEEDRFGRNELCQKQREDFNNQLERWKLGEKIT